jgi:hypothetical protein
MNLLPRILDRVFYIAGITLGQFINGPVRKNEKAELKKKKKILLNVFFI